MTEETVQNKSKRQRIGVIIASIIVLLLIVATILWFIDNRQFKRTNDAYVEGNQLIIYPLQD